MDIYLQMETSTATHRPEEDPTTGLPVQLLPPRSPSQSSGRVARGSRLGGLALQLELPPVDLSLLSVHYTFGTLERQDRHGAG